MVRKLSLVLLLALFSCLCAALPCQASDASDLDLILSSVKPGKPYIKTTFLKISQASGKDTMYEGKVGDIEILAWIQDGITDSLFLTVRGRQCPSWGPLIAKAVAPPETRIGNFRGQMLRYAGVDYEYYLVLVNQYDNKNLLTDLTIFRRGAGHEINERYHEFADIWTEIFTTPSEEFKWPDPSINTPADPVR